MISCGHLKSVFVGASNAEELRFVKCSISTEKLEFSAKHKARTKTVSFIDCGKEKYSNWKNHSEKFWPVLEAVSQNRHFAGLKRIELLDNSIPLGSLKDMIEKYYQSLAKRRRGVKFEVYDEEIHCFKEFQP